MIKLARVVKHNIYSLNYQVSTERIKDVKEFYIFAFIRLPTEVLSAR